MPFASRVVRIVSTATIAALIGVPVALSAGPPVAAARSLTGPDVASYQHPKGAAIHWRKVAKSGRTFAIVKATEGTTYVNPFFAKDYANAGTAGLVRGSYHFARPATPIVSTAVAQAKAFAAQVGTVTDTKTLPPALDLEVTGGLSSRQLVTWAQAFLLKMRKLTGRTPMLYTYPFFWSNDVNDPSAFRRFPLWMASYGSTAPTASLWQYTDAGKVRGISDPADLSQYVGATGPSWAKMADGTVATSWVDSAPAAPHDLTLVPGGGQVTVSWRPGDAGTSRVRHYVVTASSGNHSLTVGGSHTTATLTGLDPATSYTFTVKAINAVGTSPSSTRSAAVTPAILSRWTVHSSSSLINGESLPLSATLTRNDTGHGVKNKSVTLYRRLRASAPWRVFRTLTTDSHGNVSTTIAPHRSKQYELVWTGKPSVRGASSIMTIVVRPKVHAHLTQTTVHSGHAVRLYGRVEDFKPGETVTREGFFSGAWHVWKTKTINPDGTYSFAIHPTVKTVDVYRVVSQAIDHRGAGISRTVRLTVR
jgi:GH25 family lysozyme M1 (1,4-beta-N-acetylmuramidase)